MGENQLQFENSSQPPSLDNPFQKPDSSGSSNADGLKRINTGIDGENYQDLLYVRRKYIHKDQLRSAIAEVVNAIFEIRLPYIWSEGTTTCARFSSYTKSELQTPFIGKTIKPCRAKACLGFTIYFFRVFSKADLVLDISDPI